MFTYPGDLVVDSSGDLYVNEQGSVIRSVSAAGVVSTVAGTAERGGTDGGPAIARFSGITGLATLSAGGLVVADAGNQRVRTVDRAGNVSTLAGLGGQGLKEGPAKSAQFSYPTGIVEVAPGVIYVADMNYGRIFRLARK